MILYEIHLTKQHCLLKFKQSQPPSARAKGWGFKDPKGQESKWRTLSPLFFVNLGINRELKAAVDHRFT
jgi:hypothetical protein